MANGRSAKQYADAIREARGFISVAAKRLGCSRASVYNAINKHATVKEAVSDAREIMTDLAEGKLAKLINDEHPTAIIFYLKTQGKDRGYVEKHQHEHSGNVTINKGYVQVSPEDWDGDDADGAT